MAAKLTVPSPYPSIRRRKAAIYRKQEALDEEMRLLQVECLHGNATHTNKSDTGNCYWTEHVCPDCGKRWTTEQ